MLDLKPLTIVDLGFRARVRLVNGKFDRTEVDMRLGDLLIEAVTTLREAALSLDEPRLKTSTE
jgi:hypothetical protein